MTYVPGEGARDARYMIVGEAPGENEERQGRPFVGHSGNVLRYCMERKGIAPSSAYITNVCHYRPPANAISKFVPKRKGQRVPNDKVIEGMVELYRDIASIKPRVIIPVGNIALWALTGLENIGRRRGSILEANLMDNRAMLVASHFKSADELHQVFTAVNGTRVVPTYHPSAVFRQYSLKPIFEFDLARARDESFRDSLELPEREYYLDPDEHTANELAEKLLSAPTNAFDIECAGGHLFCIAFACDPSWALVLRSDAAWKMTLIRQLLGSDVPKIAQNGTFDASFLAMNEGIVVKNYAFDTMFTQKICYPDFRMGLDFICSMYTREPYYKDEGKNIDLNKIEDVEQFMLYNGKDACVTLEAAHEMRRNELEDQQQAQIVDDTMDTVPIVVDIMTHGIRVDTKRLQQHRRDYIKETKEAQAILNDFAVKALVEKGRKLKNPKEIAELVSFTKRVADEGLNVNSSKDMQYYLYKVRGYKEKRKKNKYKRMVATTEEKALKELYGETGSPELLVIVTIRKTRKMISSYLNMKLGPGDRFLFSIIPTGTKTLRWSSGQTIQGWGVNAQTMPPKIRDILIADEGMIMFYADLSQVEDRIVAYLAGVQKKIHAFENGIDAHKLTASLIFSKSIDDITKDERYLGKQSNHAFNYGEGPMTFKQNVNKRADETGVRITFAEAKSIRSGHLRVYPEIEHVYWPMIEDEIRRKRMLRNPFGWRRLFHDRLSDATFRDGYSWIPQSTAPMIVNKGMSRIRKELPQVQILLQVHDAILGQMPISEAEDLRPEILRLMDIPVPISGKEIHIPVDMKTGQSWGELE